MFLEVTLCSCPTYVVMLTFDSIALAAKLSNVHLGSILGGAGGKGKERPTCTYCGKIGHTVDKCYKKHVIGQKRIDPL